MRRWKRLFYYLMINIVVSACTTLVVLTIWERTHPLTTGSLVSIARGWPSPTPAVLATFDATTIEPTLTPSQALTTYQVQAGDTLGEIALQFGITVDEIMQLNGLENADALATGMVLFVPLVEISSPEGTSTIQAPGSEAKTTPQGPTATPGTPALEPQVMIVNVFGAGDLATERVRLERRGDGDLSLAGWQLVDEDGNVYIFPQLTLFPGGAVDLYTRSGNNDVVELYWGLEEPAWETGEIATLLDDRGIVRATFTVP